MQYSRNEAPKQQAANPQSIEQLELKLHELEINNAPSPKQQQNNNNHHPAEEYPHPDDEPVWEEGFEGDEGDDEDFDEEDFDGGFHHPPTVKDGSSCRVEGCSGVLQPHYSETGTLQYFLCSSCSALFTNHPGR